jgi:hypothetical protein
VNAAVVAVHVVQRDSGLMVFQLFAVGVVSRVKRRIDMRMVRFCVSTNDVLMCLGSRFPCMTAVYDFGILIWLTLAV